jgi:pimeloyl-ACP methyl ester carboxylesterase
VNSPSYGGALEKATLRSSARQVWSPLPIFLVMLTQLAACSAVAEPSTSATSSANPPIVTPTVVPTPNPMAKPVIDGDFAVAADGRTLHVICWGKGSPTVLLETGIPSDGLQQFAAYGHTFTSLLAARTRTCAYDRAGSGSADPAPNKPRSLDDVTGDLHALLAAAQINGPYVLVGSSGGGMIVTYYAAHYPDGVTGVVMLDVPAPSATLTLKEAPDLAWDSPQNHEHLDIVPGFENRLAAERFPFAAPLIVITATQGQSSVADQAFWLDWSPDASQIELSGGHEIYNSQPQAVADQILGLLTD